MRKPSAYKHIPYGCSIQMKGMFKKPRVVMFCKRKIVNFGKIPALKCWLKKGWHIRRFFINGIYYYAAVGEILSLQALSRRAKDTLIKDLCNIFSNDYNRGTKEWTRVISDSEVV